MKKIFFYFTFFVCSIISILSCSIFVKQAKPSIHNPGWAAQFLEMMGYANGTFPIISPKSQWQTNDRLLKKASTFLLNVKEIGPNHIGGRVLMSLQDWSNPSHYIVATASGGIWNSYDKGNSWQNFTDQNTDLAFSSIAQNPFNAQVFIAGTGEKIGNSSTLPGDGLFKSIDNGKTFERIDSTNKFLNQTHDIEYSKTDSNTVYIASGNTGLYRSTDGGKRFKILYPSGKGCSDIMAFADSTIVFAIWGYGIIKFKEAQTPVFTRFTNGLPSSNLGRISMATCKTKANVMVAAIASTDGLDLLGIYRTKDYGNTWVALTKPPSNMGFNQAWYDLAIGIHPINPDTMILGMVSNRYTFNGGKNWTRANGNMHVDHHSVFPLSDNSGFLMGNDGGMYHVKFNANTMDATHISKGLNIFQFYAGSLFPDGMNFIGGGQDNGTWMSKNQSATFSSLYGGDGSYCNVSQTDSKRMYVSYQNGELYTSYNTNPNNSTFTYINPDNSLNYYFINPFAINQKDGEQIYVVSKLKLLKSINAGSNWTDATKSLSKSIYSIGISNQINPSIYLGGAGNTLYRIDSAQTKDLQTASDLTNTAPILAKGGYISSIKVNPLNRGSIFITYSNFGANSRLWKLNNAQTSMPLWKDISGNLPKNLPCLWLDCNASDTNVLLLGTLYGLYISQDGGINWEKEERLPNVPVFQVKVRQDGYITAFTHGRGAFNALLPNHTVSTKEAIYSNFNIRIFPNPAQNHIKIESIHKFESVSIYNMNGVLLKSYSTPNQNSFDIDISTFSNGIYFVKVISNGKESIKKVLVNRN